MFPNDINKYYNLLIYTRIELNCIQAIPNFGSFFVLKMETQIIYSYKVLVLFNFTTLKKILI